MRDLGRFTFHVAQRKTRIMPMKSGGGRGKERYALKVYGQQCFHSVASDILPSQVILHERQQKYKHPCPLFGSRVRDITTINVGVIHQPKV